LKETFGAHISSQSGSTVSVRLCRDKVLLAKLRSFLGLASVQ
jgi:hypothetical protein